MFKKLLELSIACPLLFLTGCASWIPGMTELVSELDDAGVVVEVHKEALQEDTDVRIVVDVINKDHPVGTK